MRRDGVWRKSSASGGDGDCVEVAGSREVISVRGSKDRTGPVLTFSDAAWQEFVSTVRRR